ncbi:DUF6397 family protein [Streptomyces sp. NPDC051776]|uniref:DUF6397 family protein n=1 Tax=Streptomyces sp. NPDC051776 TaxID=3155414 RepID=UPI003418B222
MAVQEKRTAAQDVVDRRTAHRSVGRRGTTHRGRGHGRNGHRVVAERGIVRGGVPAQGFDDTEGGRRVAGERGGGDRRVGDPVGGLAGDRRIGEGPSGEPGFGEPGVEGRRVAEETPAFAFRRAAAELGLKPRELVIAVQQEEVRTVPAPVGTGRRVPCAEVTRLQQEEGFPDRLRERVRVVGTAEAAGLMGITQERFGRLARVGLLSPATFYVNRYRAVVWLYPAVELRAFAEREPGMLTGIMPKNLRALLDAGEDWRARNWRSRRVGQLARQTEDPWGRAAVPAALLPADELAEIVEDPYERAYLRKLRPALVSNRAVSTATWEVVERLIRADDPDEILWIRLSLAYALDEARAVRSAPLPGESSPESGGLPLENTGRSHVPPRDDLPEDGPPGAGSAEGGPPEDRPSEGAPLPSGREEEGRARGLRAWLRRRPG